VDFGPALQALPFLLNGVQVTLVISAVAIVLSGIAGLLVAYLRLNRRRPVRSIGTGYVTAIQSIPFFALLLWVYFVLPAFLGIVRPDIYVFGIATLVLTYAAYYGETYRAGILAVPSGQREAAISSGMSERQAMRRVVLPQAVRATIPAFTSLCVSTVKDSAVIGPVLGVQELMWHTAVVQGSTFRPAEAYIVAAVLYVALTFPLTLIGNALATRWRLDRSVASTTGLLGRISLKAVAPRRGEP
jgi:His/Glu/Gln/Arg/opine family amino acid ABC transporter permease subunit